MADLINEVINQRDPYQSQTVATMRGRARPPMRRPQTPLLAPGQVAPGNINLNARPIVPNADGTISTVRSIGINEGGRHFLIPTVDQDGGGVLSNADAIAQYRRTGFDLGEFSSDRAADAYGRGLHNDQASAYADRTAGPEATARDEAAGAMALPRTIRPGYTPTQQLVSDATEFTGLPQLARGIGHIREAASTPTIDPRGSEEISAAIGDIAPLGLAFIPMGEELGAGLPRMRAASAHIPGQFPDGFLPFQGVPTGARPRTPFRSTAATSADLAEAALPQRRAQAPDAGGAGVGQEYAPRDVSGNQVATEQYPFGFLSSRLTSRGVPDVDSRQFYPVQARPELPRTGQPSLEDVSTGDLIGTQEYVSPDFLHRRTPAFADLPIEVLRDGDRHYILNGHHRAAEAVARGNPTIRAQVFSDLNPAQSDGGQAAGGRLQVQGTPGGEVLYEWPDGSLNISRHGTVDLTNGTGRTRSDGNVGTGAEAIRTFRPAIRALQQDMATGARDAYYFRPETQRQFELYQALLTQHPPEGFEVQISPRVSNTRSPFFGRGAAQEESLPPAIILRRTQTPPTQGGAALPQRRAQAPDAGQSVDGGQAAGGRFTLMPGGSAAERNYQIPTAEGDVTLHIKRGADGRHTVEWSRDQRRPAGQRVAAGLSSIRGVRDALLHDAQTFSPQGYSMRAITPAHARLYDALAAKLTAEAGYSPTIATRMRRALSEALPNLIESGAVERLPLQGEDLENFAWQRDFNRNLIRPTRPTQTPPTQGQAAGGAGHAPASDPALPRRRSAPPHPRRS